MRLLLLPPVAARCFGDFLFSAARTGIRKRVQWLSRVALCHAKWIGLRIRVHGEIPRKGLIVANHVSYLDIVALSAAAACAFVSKREVATWPLFGLYAKCGATIFVDRERRTAVADVANEMRERLDAGVPLTLFPEGTSTGGDDVLPFRSSLFEPVVELACPVTARPAPLVSWSRDGRPLRLGHDKRLRLVRGELRLSECRGFDAGEYVCTAVNGFGAIRVSVTLVVISSTNQSASTSKFVLNF